MASNPVYYRETKQFNISGTNFLVDYTLHSLRTNTGTYMYVPYYNDASKQWKYHSIDTFKIGSTRKSLNDDGTLSNSGGNSLLEFTPFVADITNVPDYRPCGNNLTTLYGICASTSNVNYSYSISVPPISSSSYSIYSGAIQSSTSGSALDSNIFNPFYSVSFRTNQLNFIFNRGDYYIPFVFFGVSGHYNEASYFSASGAAWEAYINLTISDFGLQNLSNTAFQNGYDQGAEDAKATNNVIDLIANSFNQMTDILSTPLLPGFTLGGLISIPLVVTLIAFFFRMIKGGN